MVIIIIGEPHGMEKKENDRFWFWSILLSFQRLHSFQHPCMHTLFYGASPSRLSHSFNMTWHYHCSMWSTHGIVFSYDVAPLHELSREKRMKNRTNGIGEEESRSRLCRFKMHRRKPLYVHFVLLFLALLPTFTLLAKQSGPKEDRDKVIEKRYMELFKIPFSYLFRRWA